MNHFFEKIKNAELGTVIKMAVIFIVGFLVVREVMLWSFIKEVGSEIFGINSSISETQDRIEKKFNDRWENHFEEMNPRKVDHE